MKNVLANLHYWAAGIIVATVGVICARTVAPMAAGTARLSLTLGGQLLAIGGLFIICLGVRRRIKQPAEREEA